MSQKQKRDDFSKGIVQNAVHIETAISKHKTDEWRRRVDIVTDA